MRTLFLVLATVLFLGCAEQKIEYKKIDRKDINLEECEQAQEKYIKAFMQFFKDNDINGMLYVFGDSKDVVSLKSMKCREAYRCLLLRSFHAPALITVIVKGDKARLNLMVSDNSGCSFPVLIKNKTIELSKKQLQHLRNVIEENQFWKGTLSDRHGNDGYDLIIEVKQKGIYHFGKEWAPEKGAIMNIGFYLLELAEYNFDDDHIY